MTIIEVPDELANEIDRLAGVNERSAYAIDALWREVRRYPSAQRSPGFRWKLEARKSS